LLVVRTFMAATISHQRSTSSAGIARGRPPSARCASFGRRSPRNRRYSVQLRRRRHQHAALGMPPRQRQQAAAQRCKRLGRHTARPP
jgi:hypothetical protein